MCVCVICQWKHISKCNQISISKGRDEARQCISMFARSIWNMIGMNPLVFAFIADIWGKRKNNRFVGVLNDIFFGWNIKFVFHQHYINDVITLWQIFQCSSWRGGDFGHRLENLINIVALAVYSVCVYVCVNSFEYFAAFAVISDAICNRLVVADVYVCVFFSG